MIGPKLQKFPPKERSTLFASNMTKMIGLTGGIGTGKSTAAEVFLSAGIPVYNSDDRAKSLYHTSAKLKEEVIALFGKESYKDGTLNRSFLASQVFSSPKLLKQLNAIVHPLVAEDFEKWKNQQGTPWVLKEAAILIESGSYKGCDKIVVIAAPLEERIKRVMQRDSIRKEQVLERIQNQLSDEERESYADAVFQNITKKELTQNITDWISSQEFLQEK